MNSRHLKISFIRSDSQSGFTLIEFLVTIFIFSLVGLVVIGIFAKALQIERSAFKAQVLQENILAVMEVMSKEIRVGVIEDQDNDCTNTTLDFYIFDESGGQVPITYSLDSGMIRKVYGGVTYVMNSTDVTFTNLIFCIQGSQTPSDGKAAKVTILATVSNNTANPQTVRFQTTLTSRDIISELQSP